MTIAVGATLLIQKASCPAGHDAFWMSKVAPTAMVMCPCVDGLSHNEAEEISQEWAAASTNVLFHAVVETAGLIDE